MGSTTSPAPTPASSSAAIYACRPNTHAAAAASPSADNRNGGEAPQGRFTRDRTNDINYRVRAAISWDVRQQTEYGTLRTYIRFGAENTTPTATGGGTTFSPFWDRAFIQFAGFTVGRSQSFFDLFTYGGAYSYHNVRVSGDTGASGQNLWAYTAQFGNGFSGTLSLEDPATRKGADTVTSPYELLWVQWRDHQRQRHDQQHARWQLRLPGA